MKDAVAVGSDPPTKVPAADARLTNGEAPTTNGEAADQSAASIDAYENALLDDTDNSDSEPLNLELPPSDDEGGVSATDSTASTIVLSSGGGKVPSSELRDGESALVDAEGSSCEELADVKDAAGEGSGAPAEESSGSVRAAEDEAFAEHLASVSGDSRDVEERASSPECIVVEESEPIVASKSSGPAAATCGSGGRERETDSRQAEDEAVRRLALTGDGALGPAQDREESAPCPMADVLVVDIEDSCSETETAAAECKESSKSTDGDCREVARGTEGAASETLESNGGSKEEGDETTVPADGNDQVIGDVRLGNDVGGVGEPLASVDRTLDKLTEEDDTDVAADIVDSVIAEESVDNLVEDNRSVNNQSEEESDKTEDELLVQADKPVEELQLEKAAKHLETLSSENSGKIEDIVFLEKAEQPKETLPSENSGKTEDIVFLEKAEQPKETLPSENSGKTEDIVFLEKAEQPKETLPSENSGKIEDIVVLEKAEQPKETLPSETEDIAMLEKPDQPIPSKTKVIDMLEKGDKPMETESSETKEIITLEKADEPMEIQSLETKDTAKQEKVEQPADEPPLEDVKQEATETEIPATGHADDAEQGEPSTAESVVADTLSALLASVVPDDPKPTPPAESVDPEVISIGDDSNEADANASEADASKTLPNAAKPSGESVVGGEDGPKRAKRGASANPADELASKRSKATAPDGGGGAKENLNPAQKRAAAAAPDDAKKARLDSWRERKKKQMSNLEKAIARVAAGGMTPRQAELADLIGKLSSKTLVNITATQLGDLIQYKVAQYLLEKSDCSIYRAEIKTLKSEVESWQQKAVTLANQVRDLENVMKKMLTDIKQLPKGALPIPAKVNRSVGLQVGPGRITNEQKKLALPPPPLPPPAPVPLARRTGIMTNRPSTANANAATTAYVSAPPTQRVRTPVPTPTPPKRPGPGNPPALSPANRPPGLHLPFNTPPKITPPKTQQPTTTTTTVVPGAGGRLTRASTGAGATRGQPPPGALIDLTDGDEPAPVPAPRHMSVPTLRTLGPGKIRVINPGAAVGPGPGKQPGSIRLVTQSALTGAAGSRVAYMVPASSTGGEPRMYFSAAAATKQVSMNGNSVLTVARSNNAQQKTVVFSSNASQPPAGMRALPPGFKPSTFISTNRPGSNPIVRTRTIHVERKFHPAPLPPSPPATASNPSWKKPPPLPDLKISKCDKRSRNGGESGIILSWKMDALSSEHEDIMSYQLYAYQETSAEPSTAMWKKVGDVKSMALPMACTLTQFTEGNKYHFAVRAVDTRGRTGPFSKPGNILLASTYDD